MRCRSHEICPSAPRQHIADGAAEPAPRSRARPGAPSSRARSDGPAKGGAPPTRAPTAPAPDQLSNGNVAVQPRARPPLLPQRDPQGPDQLPPRAPRLDHVIDVTPLRRHERVGKPL